MGEIEEGEENDSKRDFVTQEMIANIQTRLELLVKDIVKLKTPTAASKKI